MMGLLFVSHVVESSGVRGLAGRGRQAGAVMDSSNCCYS
jgi:hypothetical protein